MYTNQILLQKGQIASSMTTRIIFLSFTFPQFFLVDFNTAILHTTFVLWGHSICCVLSSKSPGSCFFGINWPGWKWCFTLRFRRKRDARKDFWFWDLKFQADGGCLVENQQRVKMCFFAFCDSMERKLPKFSKDFLQDFFYPRFCLTSAFFRVILLFFILKPSSW